MKCAWLIILFSVHTHSNHLSGVQNSIYNELSWPIKLKLLNDYQTTTTQPTRRVGIEAFRMEPVSEDESEKDESYIKLKLFRLMYETIRDSEVKIKSTEVIKKHYDNSTVFSLGYVVGEIWDRYTVMTDIARTMRRMRAAWPPMEHIGAYEQIANTAVQVGQLADAARSLAKRDGYKENYTKKV